jgi:3',5'-cyclic AMP phosphodiesterase CpdA
MSCTKIAHLSDLHLLSLAGAVPWRLLNKRATGWLNLKLKREHKHKAELLHRVADAIRAEQVDHVVVTGDVSNLALEAEFELVRDLLDRRLGLPPERVSVVPGNHDVYTSGAFRSQRFARFFAPYLVSDLPGSAAPGHGPFPYVKLRGPVAFIGLSTAVPRPPFMAAGKLGRAQLDALARVLEHPEVESRTPVLLQHHPAHHPRSLGKIALESLHDASALRELLADVPRGLLLHGHLHTRIHQRLETERGHLDAIGATSASLLHESDARMAGWNVYEVAEDGTIASIGSRAIDGASGEVREVPVPRASWV